MFCEERFEYYMIDLRCGLSYDICVVKKDLGTKS